MISRQLKDFFNLTIFNFKTESVKNMKNDHIATCRLDNTFSQWFRAARPTGHISGGKKTIILAGGKQIFCCDKPLVGLLERNLSTQRYTGLPFINFKKIWPVLIKNLKDIHSPPFKFFASSNRAQSTARIGLPAQNQNIETCLSLTKYRNYTIFLKENSFDTIKVGQICSIFKSQSGDQHEPEIFVIAA